jgi:subtilisin family serine protease
MSPKRSHLVLALSTALLFSGQVSAIQQTYASATDWAQQQGTATISLNSVMQSAPASVAQPLATRLQAIKDSASGKGEARVIIRLQSGFTPEGQLASAQAQTQRNTILGAQNNVIDSLRQKITLPESKIKRFDTIPFLALSLSPQALDILSTTPGVIDIQPDRLARPSLAHSVPLIGGATATSLNITGQGQAVAVLDTGVEKTHTFLSGKVVSEACYSSNDTYYGSTTVCPGGAQQSTAVGSGVNCPSNIAGCDHGTHVAGIVAGQNASFHGVAPSANIIAVQVFSRFPSSSGFCSAGESYCALTYDSDQIRGLERVYALRGSYSIASVNMSLGGGYYSSQATCDSDNSAQKLAIDNLRSVGIATIIASGNDGYSTGMGSPGCISSAISVGSTTSNASGLSDNRVSTFSNSVNFLDLLAPGQTINSSVPGGGYEGFNGTSMATPHVAGTFALLKQRFPGEGVDSLEARLKSSGLPIVDTRNGLTFPRIDLTTALAIANTATQEDITQIYVAGFLRAPELDGYNYWFGQSKTASQLATDIFTLSVVKAIYPDSMSNTDFVTAIYNNVFGRAPDAGGLAYWLSELASTTRGNLVLTMIRAGLGTPDGTPGKAYLVNRVDLALYALTQQQGFLISLDPEDLKFTERLVNEDPYSVALARDVIDWLIFLAQ